MRIAEVINRMSIAEVMIRMHIAEVIKRPGYLGLTVGLHRNTPAVHMEAGNSIKHSSS